MEPVVPPVPPDEIERHVEKVLSSSTLAKSWSLGRLLRFLVAHALNGAAPVLKEYTLGVEVFDRGPEFDPREDNIVRVQVRNLRSRLTDYYADEGKDDPIRIELPKGSYQVAFKPVVVESAAPVPPEPAVIVEPARRRNWMWPVTAAVFLLVLAGIGAWFWRVRTAEQPGPHVVAVLPFSNLDPNGDTEYFSDGLAEELINSLSKLDGLAVIARSSSFRFRGNEPNLQQIGQQLNATEIVEGSIRRQGATIRVMVRLVAVPSGRTIWSGQYDRGLTNTIQTEEEIAYGVSTALKLRLVPSKPPRETAVSEGAHDLYLRGRYYWDKIDPSAAPQAIAFFEQATVADPLYSAPYVGLAGAYGTGLVWNITPPRTTWPKIKALVTRALELDETNAEAHTLMAGVAAWYELDYARSEMEYRRGVQLGPGSVITHQYFASMLGAMGRFPEADAEMARSERLDPLNQFLRWARAQLKYWEGDTEGAEAMLVELHRQDPGVLYVYTLLVPISSTRGKHEKAVQFAEEFVRRSPNNPNAMGLLGEAYARAGQVDKARGILKALEEKSRSGYVASINPAYIYLALGERKKALQMLAKACEERSVRAPWLRVDPRYKSLHHDPEFDRLLVSMNLTPQ